jgi:8-oxo-dGTP pyrophosphatase MutT (NUDIX family)
VQGARSSTIGYAVASMSSRAALLRALEPYHPFGPRESKHRERMLALLAVPGDPFRRDHFLPGHFTASAFILSPARDALLLVHHAKLDRWLQPGGHVERDDVDMLTAARREAFEEVGLAELACEVEGPFDLDVHGIPAFAPEPAHEHFDVRFLFRAPHEDPMRSAESHDVRWFPLGEIDEAHFDASVMRAVRKLARR